MLISLNRQVVHPHTWNTIGVAELLTLRAR